MSSIVNIATFDELNTGETDQKQAIYRCAIRRKTWPLRRNKKKKLPTVRLGAGKRQLLVRMLKRIRIRWLKLKKACTLRKLKEYYSSILKDVFEAGGTFETFQQRLILESSFAVPVMGLSFNSFH